jgi:signal peptidase I
MANYFSIFLVIVTAVSGLTWLLDAILWAPKRKAKIDIAKANTNGTIDDATLQEIAPLPVVVDTAQQIFPVIAFVLVLRSFLYEPFQIPSGSMKPTLLVGDFILVEKFTYGLKDPVARNQFYDVGTPERGDIVVFKYPDDPMVDYIKRVIATPGDRIKYRNKTIHITKACEGSTPCESQIIEHNFENNNEFFATHPQYGELKGYPLTKSTETIDGKSFQTLRDPSKGEGVRRYYDQPGTARNEWVVPEGHYFVMGDNRDNSLDSRFWGFVPEENLVGKAVAIWMSFEFERAEDSFLPGFIPTGVRFERIGGIQ